MHSQLLARFSRHILLEILIHQKSSTATKFEEFVKGKSSFVQIVAPHLRRVLLQWHRPVNSSHGDFTNLAAVKRDVFILDEFKSFFNGAPGSLVFDNLQNAVAGVGEPATRVNERSFGWPQVPEAEDVRALLGECEKRSEGDQLRVGAAEGDCPEIRSDDGLV